jgi:UDP-N-acetylmuramoyl-tripeptide--D-alanyl-D-alanine ligase
MTGRHNLMNALAAAAVATSFQIGADEIAAALKTAVPPHMRGEVLEFAAGFTVVDDSYNSNPRSLISMVQSVADAGENVQRRLVVAGEMMELGPQSAAMHREAGREIADLGIDVLWGVRGLAEEIVAGATQQGMREARFFATSDDAAMALVEGIRAGDLVLIKGSRSVETDKVVKHLRRHFPLVGEDQTIGG